MLAAKMKNRIELESVCGPSAPGVPGKVAPLRTQCPNAGQHGPGWVEAKDGGSSRQNWRIFYGLNGLMGCLWAFFYREPCVFRPKEKGVRVSMFLPPRLWS